MRINLSRNIKNNASLPALINALAVNVSTAKAPSQLSPGCKPLSNQLAKQEPLIPVSVQKGIVRETRRTYVDANGNKTHCYVRQYVNNPENKLPECKFSSDPSLTLIESSTQQRSETASGVQQMIREDRAMFPFVSKVRSFVEESIAGVDALLDVLNRQMKKIEQDLDSQFRICEFLLYELRPAQNQLPMVFCH